MYDTIILGAGPAGLSAAIYSKRYDMETLVIGKEMGTMSEADEVCNYLGYPSVGGTEMAMKFTEHAEKLGAEIKRETVSSIEKKERNFIVKTGSGEYRTKTIIYAFGGEKRKMGLPEEKDYVGKGVSYCFTCDAAFFRNKTVAVTGGANSAAMGALVLSKFADKVYIIYRRDALRAFPVYVEKINENNKIETIFNSNIKKIIGDKVVEKVLLENNKTGEKSELELDGVFVEFGHVPNSSLAKNLGVVTDERGRISVGRDMSTNIPGFFAAGDVTNGSNGFDQVVTAASEGAIAAGSVYKKITEGD